MTSTVLRSTNWAIERHCNLVFDRYRRNASGNSYKVRVVGQSFNLIFLFSKYYWIWPHEAVQAGGWSRRHALVLITASRRSFFIPNRSNEVHTNRELFGTDTMTHHMPKVSLNRADATLSKQRFIVSLKWAILNKSRLAQWKRAGPITQRSVDRNHGLLTIFFIARY